MHYYDFITNDGHTLKDGEMFFTFFFDERGDIFLYDEIFNQDAHNKTNYNFGCSLLVRPTFIKKNDWFKDLSKAYEAGMRQIERQRQLNTDQLFKHFQKLSETYNV